MSNSGIIAHFLTLGALIGTRIHIADKSQYIVKEFKEYPWIKVQKVAFQLPFQTVRTVKVETFRRSLCLNVSTKDKIIMKVPVYIDVGMVDNKDEVTKFVEKIRDSKLCGPAVIDETVKTNIENMLERYSADEISKDTDRIFQDIKCVLRHRFHNNGLNIKEFYVYRVHKLGPSVDLL